jgi:nucleotide-binding universal stress UspA family protein
LREGALLAKRCRARVFLLAVTPIGAAATAAEGVYPGTIPALVESHRAILEEGAMLLCDIGLLPQARLVAGDPVKQIAAYAKEVSADLVVVGHRRKTALARWWSGSGGVPLSDHLDCTLLVARNTISDAQLRAELDASGGVAAALNG